MATPLSTGLSKLTNIYQPSDGRYGLALDRDGGQRFIIVLVALMSFLAVLTLCASFALSNIAHSWSSGLERKLTVEIPALNADGDIRSTSEKSNLRNEIKKTLHEIDYVQEFKFLENDSVAALILPWLGESDDNASFLDEIPVPMLVAIELKNTAGMKDLHSQTFQDAIQNLTETLHNIDPTITVDTHEEWLSDFLQVVALMRFSTLFIALVVAVSAITAVSGVMRSHIAEYKPDIELLHLIGANDRYIAKQFERYALRLGLLGGFWGLGAGAVVVLLFKVSSSIITSGSYQDVMPEASLNFSAIVLLLSIPFIACILCSLSARITVLHSLSRMP